MRTIKFRGKRIDNGEWVYGWFVGNYTARYATIVNWDGIEFTGGRAEYAVVPETVGQFIGLKDCADPGKEIYADDIVNIEFFKDCRCSTLEERAVIKFYANGWCSDISENWIRSIRADDIIEIIGNIYENPELLKES